jgi:sugar lactone lactonase YvrE
MHTRTPARAAYPTLAGGLKFAEGIRWHDGQLWVSDMLGKRIVRIDQQGHVHDVAQVENCPSGLGWLPDGRMIAVSMVDAKLLLVGAPGLEVYAELGSICRGTPNDMVVDGQGRAYVGNAGCNLFAGLDPRPTNLVLVVDGAAREVADDLIFPNGMAITPDGRTLIVAETFAHRLTAFDIEPDGSLAKRRVFADTGNRTPDGICLDADGAAWISSPDTSEFVRILPGGEVTEVIDADGRFAASCATGGEQRKTLFMAVSRTTPQQFMRGESESSIETKPLSVGGAGLP